MCNSEPAIGDGCPVYCGGNTVCRKWTGLAAGFGQYFDKVVRTVVGSEFIFVNLIFFLKSLLVGDPGGSSCALATGTAGNDANFKITVDNGNMHWFKTEGCAWEEGAFPRDTRCVNKNSMAQELGEKITWDIESPQPDPDFKQLFTFALLPQKAAKAHSSEKYLLYDGRLDGPKCDEIYVKFVRFHYSFLISFSILNFSLTFSQAVHSSCWCPKVVVLSFRPLKLFHHNRQIRTLQSQQLCGKKVEEVWESSSS